MKFLETIERIRGGFRPFQPSFETELIHVLLFIAGISVGLVVLFYQIIITPVIAVPPPDFLGPDVHFWHPEAKELFMYYLWIFLLPAVSFLIWLGGLFLIFKIINSIYVPEEKILFAMRFSFLYAFFSFLAFLLFLSLQYLGILNIKQTLLSALAFLFFAHFAPFYLFRRFASWYQNNLSVFFFPPFFKFLWRNWNRIFFVLALFFSAIAVSTYAYFYQAVLNSLLWHRVTLRFSSVAASTAIGFSLSIVLTFFLFIIVKKRQSFNIPNVSRAVEFALVFLVIFFLLFNPAYKYEFDWLGASIAVSHYDNFIMAALNDVLHGKTLLVDTMSHYGILNIYVLAPVFRYIVPLSYANAYAFFMLVNIVYYFLLYVFLRFFLKSGIFALLGMGFIAAVNVLGQASLYPPREIYTWPTITAYRFFFDVPIYIFLLLYLKDFKRRYLYIISFLGAWALFHSFDRGQAILLAIIVAFFLKFFLAGLPVRDKLKMLLKEYAVLFSAVVFSLLMISVFTFFRSGQFPDWLLPVSMLKIFMSGFAGHALPVAGYYYLILAVYFIITMAIITKIFFGALSKELVVAGAITVFGTAAFSYYISQSHPNNLYQLTIPAGILFIYMFRHFALNVLAVFRRGAFFANIAGAPAYYVFGFIFFLGVMLSAEVHNADTFAALIKKRWFTGKPDAPILSYRGTGFADYGIPPPFENFRTLTGIRTYYYPSNAQMIAAADYIQSVVLEGERVTLLSRYDTLLFLMSNRVNSLDTGQIYLILTKSQISRLQEQLKKQKPKFILIDSDRDGIEFADSFMMRYIFSAVENDYTLYKKVEFLDVYINNDYL